MSSTVVRPLVGFITIIASLASFNVASAESVDPVVVTATRTAESGDSTLSPMIVIDAATLEQNPGATVPDILRMYTGIELGRNGGPLTSTSIFMRGTNSNQTLVLVDGVKINPGTSGGASLQNIDTSMIERIEVVKGPRSTLYGSDAIGGVINIITKRSKKAGSTYDAAIGAGSYGTKSLKFGATNRTEDKSAGIQISAADSKGFPTFSDSNIDRGYKNLNIHLYGSQRIDSGEIEINHWHANGKVEYMGVDSSYNPVIPQDSNIKTESTALTVRNTPSTTWVSKLKFTHMLDEYDENQTSSLYHTQRYGIDWQNDIQINNANLATAGANAYSEHTKATQYDKNTSYGAVFIQNKYESSNQKLVAGVSYNQHETYGNKTTWNLEYGYMLTNSFRVIAANNSGFRAPNSAERFGTGGNPDLKPESSINTELGLRYAMAANHHFELNIFRNNITDLISYGPAPTYQLANIGSSRIDGIEAAYAYTSKPFTAHFSITLQNPVNLDDNSQLLRRSKQSYSAQLNYNLDSSNIVGMAAYYSGTRSDYNNVDPFELLDNKSYLLVNLTAQHKFNPKLTLNTRIENLTNQDYTLAYGYQMPGRSAYLELKYQME